MKKRIPESITLLVLSLSLAVSAAEPQRRASASAPRIDIEDYKLQATITPEAHEFKALATITFRPLEETDVVLLEMSENLSVRKVLDSSGVEIEFGQDETGPGTLTLRFPKALPAKSAATIGVEYAGGFDRDRYSRYYNRDESSAYVGVEGSYLLYPSRWFPLNRLFADRSTATLEVSVPLGFTVIGPGRQLPVATRGVTETFGWVADRPILPNSVVAARYLPKRIQTAGFVLDCFVREEHLDAVDKYAEAIGRILEYYQKRFGPPASGGNFRIAEVDDRLAAQPGTLGTIFLTHRELSQSIPVVRALAQKVAYQWWDDTVGVQGPEDLWLADGMAYFSAYLFLEETAGETAAKEEMKRLTVQGLKFESKAAIRNGLSLGFRTEQYLSVVAGKGAYVLIMLRQLLGPAKFTTVLQQYVEQFAGKGGATQGLRKLAEASFGADLGWFFAQWIDTTGIPNLQTEYMTYKTRDGFRVAGTVTQDRDLFRSPVDIEVETATKPARITVELSGKSTPFDIATTSLPSRVIIDPDNKLLRDSKELQLDVQLSLGDDLKEREQFVDAIRAYENAIKLNPRKSLAHFRLAEVFWEQSNLQSAANSFRDALNGDKDPSWTEVWSYIYLGKIYDILGQRQRALAEYNKALNTKDGTFGAQEEAKKYLAAPFTREKAGDTSPDKATERGNESPPPGNP